MFQRIRKPISLLIVIALTLLPVHGYADAPGGVNELPTGGSIVGGATNGTIVESGSTMDVNQTAQDIIADWNTFNIGSNATVNFNQPNSGATALNRIHDGNISEIWGALSANGQIFLINTNGILFAPGSHVDAAGLIASTLNITDDDFNSGNYNFAGTGGTVINRGAINITEPGGYAALLGAGVANSGTITADLGSVVLASGKALTVSMDAYGYISVAYPALNSEVTTAPAGVTDQITNSGTLQANGGKVLLTAKALDGVFDHAINNSGIIEANTIMGEGQADGLVRLEANGDIYVSNDVEATIVEVWADDADVEIDSAEIEAYNPNGYSYIGIEGDNVSINSSDLIVTSDDNEGETNDAELEVIAKNDIGIANSTLWAQANGTSNETEIYLASTDAGSVTINNSNLYSYVEGDGHAAIYINDDEDALEYIDFLGLDILDLIETNPINGSININDSTLIASTNTTTLGAATAIIGMVANDISITNSDLTASDINGIAAIGMLAMNNINIDSNSTLTAESDYLAGIGLAALGVSESTGDLTVDGTITADGGTNGFGIVGLLAKGNITTTGDVTASGGGDAIAVIEALIEEETGEAVDLDIGEQYGSAVLMAALRGDITTGNVTGDIVGLSAVDLDGLIDDAAGMAEDLGIDLNNLDEVDWSTIDFTALDFDALMDSVRSLTGGGSIDANGVNAKVLGMLASGDINANTTVDTLAAISTSGSIDINETDEVYLAYIEALGSTVDITTGGNTNVANILAQGNGAGDPAGIHLNVAGDLILDPHGVISAVNNSDGAASVMLDAEKITINSDSIVEAIVFGDGEAEVNIDAGDGDISITKSSILAQIGSGAETAKVSIGTDGGVIDIIESEVKALVLGDGSAEIGIHNFPNIGEATINNTTITDSIIEAIVEGNGASFIDLESGHDVILNGTDVLAQISGGKDARIDLEAINDVKILNTSELISKVLRNGNATVGINMNPCQESDSCNSGAIENNIGNILIDNSYLRAYVFGDGDATVNSNPEGNVSIVNNSEIKAVNYSSESSGNKAMVSFAGGYDNNVLVSNSTLEASILDSGEAYIYLRAGDTGDVTLNDSILLAQANEGTVGIDATANEGNILIDPTTIIAKTGNGDSRVLIDTNSGNVTIEDSNIQSVVEGGSGHQAEVVVNSKGYYDDDVLKGGNIIIDDTDLLADVDGSGTAKIKIGPTSSGCTGDCPENTHNVQIINNSSVVANIGSGDDTAEIDIYAWAGYEEGAGQILIQDSLVKAEVEETGSADVDIQIKGYGTYQRDMVINNSTVEAVVNGQNGGYQNANVNLFVSGYDYGDAARNLIIKNDSTIKSQVVGNNSSSNASADVHVEIAGCTDGAKHISIEDSSVLAKVLDGGNAEIEIYNYAGAGDGPSGEIGRLINIDGSTVEATVNEDGSEGVTDASADTYLSIYCGGLINDREIIINNSSEVRAEVRGENSSSYVGIDVLGIGHGDRNIRIDNNSLVESLTIGDNGNSEVYLATKGYSYWSPGDESFEPNDLPGGRSIVIDNNSTVRAEVQGEGSALVNIDALPCGDEIFTTYDEGSRYWEYGSYFVGGDVIVQNGSKILAQTENGFDSAEINITAGNITLNNGAVKAIVSGAGSADVFMDAYGSYGWHNWGYGNEPNSWDEGASYGSYSFSQPGEINILNGSDVLAQIGSGVDTAYIEMIAGDINLANSSVTARVIEDGIAQVYMETLWGYQDSADNTWVSEGYGGYWDGSDYHSIDFGNINLGSGSTVLAEVGGEGRSEVDLIAGGGYGKYTPGSEFTGGNINGSDTGIIISEYAGLLARYNIGSADAPINTNVDYLSAYSTAPGYYVPGELEIGTLDRGLLSATPLIYVPEEGNIFINETDDIELGFLTDAGDSYGYGASVAANNGIVHVTSAGDMIVNSIVTPRGGVYLQSTEGSVYAGIGWAPMDYREYQLASISSMSFLPGPDFLSVLDNQPDMYIGDTGWMDVIGEGDYSPYFTPMAQVNPESFGPNIISGGYSYISTPKGTIGVGYPGFKDPAISGQVLGYVDPLVTTVNDVQGLSLDLRFGPPPGYVDFANIDAEQLVQVWPEISPTASGSTSFDNPLYVASYVFDGSHDARPVDYVATGDASAALTLQIGNNQQEDIRIPFLFGPDGLEIYYELSQGFRVASFEPATPTTFFGYHPISSTDASAFDAIALDAGAYDFIDGNLRTRNPLAPFFGEEEEQKKKK